VDTLDIAAEIRIPMAEIQLTAIRSQGAGGQNVNKVASAIQCRFDSQDSAALPDAVKRRLLQMRDRRITHEGVINIKSQAFRSQSRNREAALTRLSELIARALHTRKRRVPTRPGKHVERQRLDNKNRRGELKRSRGKVVQTD